MVEISQSTFGLIHSSQEVSDWRLRTAQARALDRHTPSAAVKPQRVFGSYLFLTTGSTSEDIPFEHIDQRAVSVRKIKGYLTSQLDIEEREWFDRYER